MKKKCIGLAIAAVAAAIMLLLPMPNGLDAAGRNTMILAIVFLILLMSEVMSSGVLCFLTIAAMPIIGVTKNFGATVGLGFSNPLLFFILASFGISAAFVKVPLTRRILVKILKTFGKDVRTMIFAVMVSTALVSSLISNIPTTAIFMVIGLSFLDMYSDSEEKNRTGKAFMIAIPIASMIGGMMTPAGSSLNLLAIGLLEQLTGETITFVQWMLVGIPLCAAMLPIAWAIIVKVYKPAEIPRETIIAFTNGEKSKLPSGMDRKEMAVIAITLGMLSLWILSSWVSAIEVSVVALVGCCLLFLPGIEVLSWKDFTSSVNWEVIFITGTVLCVGKSMVNNGVSDWLVAFYPADIVMNTQLFMAMLALFVFLLLILIPVAPALITMLAGPFVLIAQTQGVSVKLAFLALGMCAANCYLFPIDSVPLLTYGTGYYKMSDMPKSAALIQICMVVLVALWLPIAGSLFGIA
ncbi:MAG: SLC13 family permease [Oscillospiraceae bacterium]